MSTSKTKSDIPHQDTLAIRLRATKFSAEETFIIIQLWRTRYYRKQLKYRIYFGTPPIVSPGFERFDYWIGHPDEGITSVDGTAVIHLISLGVLVFEMSTKEYEVQCSLGINPPRYYILSTKWCRYGLVKANKYTKIGTKKCVKKL